MKKLMLCLSFILFSLCACDLKISSTINISDLFSPTNKVVLSDLMVEVTSCSDDDVQELISEMQSRKISAQYNNCLSGDIDDYAVFSMPIMIVKDENNAKKEGVIYLSVKDKKLYLHSSDKINSLLESDEGDLEVKEVTFNLINDTEQDLKIKVQYVFVNGKPVVSQTINLAPYSKTNIRLSDVASKQLEMPDTSLQIVEFE